MPSTAKANTTDNAFMVGFMSGLLQKLTLETDFERHQRETDSGVAHELWHTTYEFFGSDFFVSGARWHGRRRTRQWGL